MPSLSRLTDGQLCRLYRQVWKRMEERLNGGMSFGIDLRTLRFVWPTMATTIVAILGEMTARGLQA
jgi:hypothetical protein